MEKENKRKPTTHKKQLIIAIVSLSVFIVAVVTATVAILASSQQQVSSSIQITYTSKEVSGDVKYTAYSANGQTQVLSSGVNGYINFDIVENATISNLNSMMSTLTREKNYVVVECEFKNRGDRMVRVALSVLQQQKNNIDVAYYYSRTKLSDYSVITNAQLYDQAVAGASDDNYYSSVWFYIKVSINDFSQDGGYRANFNWHFYGDDEHATPCDIQVGSDHYRGIIGACLPFLPAMDTYANQINLGYGYTEDGTGIQHIYSDGNGNPLIVWDGANHYEDYYHLSMLRTDIVVYDSEYEGYRVATGVDKSLVTSLSFSGSTHIAPHGFDGCTNLTSVTVTDGGLSVGEYGFRGCTNLTTISASSVSAGNSAFYGCTSLSTIPDIHEAGDYAFYYCRSLASASIYISESSIGESAFENCTSLATVWISNSNIDIGDSAFYGCTSLTNVTFSNNQSAFGGDIGTRAFANTSLTSVQIDGENGNEISSYAFSGCTSLTSVIVRGMRMYGVDYPVQQDDYTDYPIFRQGVFANCSNLTSITGSNSNGSGFSFTNNSIIKYSTLIAGCKTTTIPNNVTSIGAGAFYGIRGLTSIDIPSGVTSIGAEAFRNCADLTSVTIPDTVTSIGTDAFTGCPISYTEYGNAYYLGNTNNLYMVLVQAKDTEITSCNIHANTKMILANAFLGCTALQNISIPNGVTTIGTSAFSGCSLLTSISIPVSVTSIDLTAFDRNYIQHISVDAGNSVYSSVGDCLIKNGVIVWGCAGSVIPTDSNVATSIGANAFNGCTTLTSIILPSNITSIGASAFNGCTGLTTLTIAASDVTLGTDAFKNCTGVTHLSIAKSSIISGNVSAFKSSLQSLEIMQGVTTINSSAFIGFNSLTRVTISSTSIAVNGFKASSFLNCTNLKDVIIDNSAIAASLTSNTKPNTSNLIRYADNIYLLNGISATSWVTTNYPNTSTVTIGNNTYTKYSK